MAYILPGADKFKNLVRELSGSYKNESETMYYKGIFSSVIGSVDYPNAQLHLEQIQTIYNFMDAHKTSKRIARMGAEAVKSNLAGTCFLVLFQINGIFPGSAAKEKSALGRLLLNHFGVDSYDNIPFEEKEKHLKSIEEYLLNTVSTQKAVDPKIEGDMKALLDPLGEIIHQMKSSLSKPEVKEDDWDMVACAPK